MQLLSSARSRGPAGWGKIPSTWRLLLVSGLAPGPRLLHKEGRSRRRVTVWRCEPHCHLVANLPHSPLLTCPRQLPNRSCVHLPSQGALLQRAERAVMTTITYRERMLGLTAFLTVSKHLAKRGHGSNDTRKYARARSLCWKGRSRWDGHGEEAKDEAHPAHRDRPRDVGPEALCTLSSWFSTTCAGHIRSCQTRAGPWLFLRVLSPSIR